MFNKNKKWTIYLFYNGICIKKLKIDGKNKIETMYIRVYGHKKLFGKWIVGLMVEPKKLLKTDEDKKKTYWGVVFEKGVDL
jgi:hypothetical protein